MNKIENSSGNAVNSTGIGGFQISLETIHQHDELFEMDSSNESLTSNSFVETTSCLSYQKLDGFPQSKSLSNLILCIL